MKHRFWAQEDERSPNQGKCADNSGTDGRKFGDARCDCWLVPAQAEQVEEEWEGVIELHLFVIEGKNEEG